MTPFNSEIHNNLIDLGYVHTQSAPDPHPCADIPFDQYVNEAAESVVIILEDGSVEFSGPIWEIVLI